jgi:two-component system cell cycle response regulator
MAAMGESWKTMRIEALRDFDINLPRDSCLLTMLEGPTPGAIQQVGDECVLGRGEDLPARIDDRGMSRRHARIFKLEGRFYVEDLGSTNGTRVNGVRVPGAHKLEDGDRIQLGESTLLRATMVDAREAEAARKLYESAVRDALTNTFNRGHFDERLQAEFAFAIRHGVPLSVLMLDIDYFKKVNDTYGHPAGDAVLAAAATAIAGAIRTEDELARYGGEELVIIARGIDHQHALFMGERIRATIEALTITHEQHVIHVTASLGVATMDETVRFAQPDELLSAADRAVYAAKNAGRNRVCSARH